MTDDRPRPAHGPRTRSRLRHGGEPRGGPRRRAHGGVRRTDLLLLQPRLPARVRRRPDEGLRAGLRPAHALSMATSDVARWRENLQGEVDGAHVYRAMADRAGDDRLAELYRRMGDVEE